MKKRYSLATLALFCASTLGLLFSTTSFAQIPSYVPANGLVAWYPFNGNANDESGNGNDGQGQNGVTLCGDRLNQVNSAYEFDGVDDHIAISGQFNAGQTLPDFAIACWFMSHNQQDRILWSKSGFWKEIVLSVNSNNQISLFYAYPNPQAYYGITATTPVTSNNWNHVVVSQVNGLLQLYVNGNLIQTANSNNFTNWAQDNGGCSTGENFIGMGRYCQSYNYLPFNGKIDDLGFWNRALSAEEITALFTSQAEPTCNLGIISTPAATTCSGESISLVAEPAATAGGCFNPKVKQAGNQNFGITSTHRDAQGNYYMSGAYSGATTIDGIAVPSIGNRDIFLAKYNSCGQIQWVTRGGSSGDQDFGGDGSHGIATDADGNVYIVGRYNQAFTFYGANSTTFSAPWTSTSNGNHQDGFLVKLNSSGQVVWGASLRGTSNDGFVGVAVDGAGNPVVTGGFNGCCPSSFAVTIFGPNGSLGVNSFGINYGSGLVVKFDANGNILWKAAVYNRDTGLGSLAIDASNNIYLTASFRSWSSGTAAQFIDASGANNSLFNPGIGLGYLVKLNASGNWQWGTTFGNVGDGVSSLTSGSDVAIDASGNPWVVGYFRGAQATVYSTNGSNLTIPASTNDIGFLISFNAAGVAQSVVTRQQSTGSTYYRSLAIANDKIAVAGHFTGANAGLNDILLANYSATGTFIDAQTAGGGGEDYALSIIPSNSEFAVCGSTAGGFTLDGVSVPAACTYLWNLGAGQGQATVSWSNGATTSTIEVSPTTTTTYTATFSDGTNSCTQEVAVTVNQPSSSAIEATITEGESYDFNGQSLTTAGTYEAVLVNAAGCDSTVTLTLSVESSVSCSIESVLLSVCAGDSVQLFATDNGFLPCSGGNQGALEWELLIPASAYNAGQINFNTTGFDKQTSKFYSVLKNGSINQVYCFDFNTNQVSSIPSGGGPGELYSYAFDFTNQRLVATRAGRDAVFALPLSGGTWQQIGAGGFDAESYGGRAFWNPVSNRFGYFGGYGFFAMKNWVWESSPGGWVNPYPNNNSCNPAKRNTQFAPDASGTKLFLFSGQGSCDGNQFASSCSLGSPWQTDVGQYCWLRDLYELDLSNYQFTQVLAPNNQSIAREGSFAYDYDNDDFYIIGGFVPSGNYAQNQNNYGNSYSMEVLRFRRGLDNGFTPVTVGGTIPPVPNNSIGAGTSVYDANNNRIIYIRPDGVWALNLSTPCPQTYTWSTGETTPSITVTPTETTTYTVTVTQGDQTCTSDVNITVLPNETYYADADGDGFGNFEMPLTTCDLVIPDGYTLDNTDCNDADALNFPFAPCDDGDACTIEDVVQLDCTCAGFFADSDEDGTCDANDLCQGGLEPGTPCDDGEPCTVNDVIQSDCFCFGTVLDVDNDGVCDIYDACNGAEPGTACDDNDPCTVNDSILADCSCAGTFADADNDGTCDANDLCAGPEAGTACDDNDPCTVDDIILADCSCSGTFTDADNDGTCDANDNCAGSEAGAACDDNDPCTVGDVILTDCSCAGNFADADNDGTCDANDLCAGPEAGSACDDNDPCTVGDVILADCSCAGNFADADNDGTCNANDLCAGPEAGTACDDNDPCTVGDVILSDCSCAGTFADADNDGTCDANDNCAGPEAGAACDDNDPCTVNDSILADCSCVGTFADTDNDGTCDANDLCAGPEAGAACDDNDPCTVNDIIREDCSCVGVYIDSDEDGVCDANDLCAGPEAGSICDDNDPCTVDDVILADCSCAGTIADSDNDGVCDAFDLCFGPEPGSNCDDGNPCTINDVVNEACTCMGEPVAVNTSITSATDCDSYMWNGQQYTASGTYTIQTFNAAGCDSLATLVLEIRQSSFAPQSASASLTTITAGQSVTLSVVGGSLGTNAQWMWYSGSCGGTLVGQGASISVSPSATATYFVRAVGECNTTACASVTVNVSALPCGPQTITASSISICAGNAVTLSVTGVLSTGAVWKWYKNGCGLGTSLGTGATIAVIPTTNTSYFVRAEGGSCGLTSCLSVAITVSSVPAKPTVIAGPNAALCLQQGVVYSTPQLSGVISYLWTVPSGATIVSGQGTSSITVNFSSSISPNSTCGYTGICVSALNGCGASLHHCMRVSLTPDAPAGIVASASVCRFQEATFSVLNPIAGMSYTWEVPNNWQILSGQGTSTITAMVGLNNGQVRVYATNTCGMSKKFSRFVGPINCNRSETSLQLDVWPNPASQNVKFAHGGIQPEILEIYDLLGREIYRGDWVGEWNAETLEAGVYFVRVTHQGESVVKRLEVAR